MSVLVTGVHLAKKPWGFKLPSFSAAAFCCSAYKLVCSTMVLKNSSGRLLLMTSIGSEVDIRGMLIRNGSIVGTDLGFAEGLSLNSTTKHSKLEHNCGKNDNTL